MPLKSSMQVLRGELMLIPITFPAKSMETLICSFNPEPYKKHAFTNDETYLVPFILSSNFPPILMGVLMKYRSPSCAEFLNFSISFSFSSTSSVNEAVKVRLDLNEISPRGCHCSCCPIACSTGRV